MLSIRIAAATLPASRHAVDRSAEIANTRNPKESDVQNDMVTHGIASQLLAGLYMLKDCMDRCPEKEWNERHRDYPFSQVAFHTLFDCDLKMCDKEEELTEQDFHKKNREDFADYEDLEDRAPQNLYERDFLNRYYEHCKAKVISVIETKSGAEIIAPNADVFGNMSKVERYVNIVRHIQHHAAQLGLRLQFSSGKEIGWVSRGYEN